MAKNIDLTGKILINDHFQITIGRFIFVMLVTLTEFFTIFAINNWVFTPALIIIFSNMLFSMEKRYDKSEEIID